MHENAHPRRAIRFKNAKSVRSTIFLNERKVSNAVEVLKTKNHDRERKGNKQEKISRSKHKQKGRQKGK